VRAEEGGLAEEEGELNEREAAVWRKARDAVRDSSATSLGGPRPGSVAQVRQAGSNYEDRLTKLETSMTSLNAVNVTSLAKDIARLTEIHAHTGWGESDGFDSGDTAWIIVATTLVLLMTIPGLALFYGGLVRVQNVLSTVMQSFSIACLITVEWMLMGYSLSFTEGGIIFGDTSRFWLQGLSMTGPGHPLMPTVPEPVFCMFELTFAIITPALICGSFADRLKFGPMLVFMGLWHLIVYCPLSHAMWMKKGFLHKANVLDFAGGNVVHVAAGFSGLVCSIVVGKRANFGRESFHPHNILISVLGAALLWVGWMGFNGGTAGSAGWQAALACLNSQIAAATGSLSWMTTEWLIRKRPSVLGIISGALAGLVCITPGAGFVDTTGAFVSGMLAGPTCFAACQLKKMFKFDDALDAFGIHGASGVLGGILTGFFAKKSIGGERCSGVFEGNGIQLALQLYGIAISIVWSMLATGVLLKLIDLTMGLRVGIDEELLGLDMACHGETVFPQNIGIDWGTEPRSEKSNPGAGALGTSAGGVSGDWLDNVGTNNSNAASRSASNEMHRSQGAAAHARAEEPADNASFGVA